MKINIHYLMFSLLLAMLSPPLFANPIINTNENTPSQTTAVPKTATVAAENAENITKGVIFNQGSLDVMLNSMQKQGEGEVISQPKVITSDKEHVRVLRSFSLGYYCVETLTPREPNHYDYDLMVTPEIMDNEKVKLYVEFTLYDNINNTQQSKAFTKVVDDNGQYILFDELIVPIPDKKDRSLLVFISPRIMYPLRRDFIAIKYVDANKIIATFTRQYLTGAKDEGSVIVEKRTNAIIAQLTEKNLDKLRQLVVKMDVPATRMP